MTFSRAATILALFLGALEWSFAADQDTAAADAAVDASIDATVNAGVDTSAGDAAVKDAEEAVKTAQESGQQYADSAKELGEKLQQLKALLDAKGEDADPALKERLAGLSKQLAGLGIGDDGLLGGAGSIPSSPELTEFLSGCVAMSMRRVGVKRPSTLGILKRLADGKMTKEEASKVDLIKMVGTCVNEFTEQELKDFKAGKLQVLPKAYVEASKKPEAEKNVLEIEDGIWNELQKIAGGLVTQLVGDSNEQDMTSTNYVAMVGAVPLILMLGFLGRKFIMLQQEKGEKKEKRKGKKSQ